MRCGACSRIWCIVRSRWNDRGNDRGSITAEFAIVLPGVVLVLGLCLAAVQAGGQQLRLTDAAATAARALGRGESVEQATALANGVAERSVQLSVHRPAPVVCVDATAHPDGFFATLTLRARACAADGGV